MIRKLFFAASGTALLIGIAMGTGAWSYGRLVTEKLTRTAKDRVPMEWEIDRARQMIQGLEPEIAENARRIAREKIATARLGRQVEQSTEQLADLQRNIERLTDDLRGGEQSFAYAGKTYTATQVRDDLSARWKRFRTQRETLDKLEQQREARQASLAAANERMDAMLSAKRQLEVEVENLQARLAALRAAQTSSQLNLDDSQLSRTRQLLDDIQARIDVEEEVIAVDSDYFSEIPLDRTTTEDLLNEISSYFSGDRDAGARLANQL